MLAFRRSRYAAYPLAGLPEQADPEGFLRLHDLTLLVSPRFVHFRPFLFLACGVAHERRSHPFVPPWEPFGYESDKASLRTHAFVGDCRRSRPAGASARAIPAA